MKNPAEAGTSDATNVRSSVAPAAHTLPPLVECQEQHTARLQANTRRSYERAALFAQLPLTEAVASLQASDRNAVIGHLQVRFWSAACGLAALGAQP